MSDAPLRHKGGTYIKNDMYKSSGGGGSRYCFGHKQHRPSIGGRALGALRMFYCAECVAARQPKKELPK